MTSNWNISKSSLFAFLVLLASICAGQSKELIKTIDIVGGISAISYDYQSNFYVGTKDGKVLKYNTDGELLEELQLPNANEISLIEAQNPLKVFSFYRENQEFVVQERFISNSAKYPISDYSTSYVSIATPAMDHSFWMIELPQKILKKINQATGQTILNVPLDAQFKLEEVSHLKSHRDLLIISDTKNGVFITDQFGNLISQHAIQNVKHAQIINDQLVTLSGDEIITLDLYALGSEKMKAPSAEYEKVLKFDSVLVLFADQRIDLYSLPR